MSKKLFFIPILLCWPLIGLCQVTFSKTYGGTIGHSVIQTNDGGYAVVGIAPDSGVRRDFYLIKTNEFGDAIWTKKYLTWGDDRGYGIVQTSDGDFVLAGILDENPDWEGWCWGTECFMDNGLIRTDANGDTLWVKKWGSDTALQDGIYDIKQTDDGGFIITGFWGQKWGSPGSGNSFLAKLTSNGDTVWTKKYGLYSFAYSVQQTIDKGYVIAATKAPTYPPTLADIYVIKTDSVGNTIWEKTFYGGGDGFFAEGRDIEQTLDSGYIVTGYVGMNNTYEAYLIKLDKNGDSLWSKTYGGLSDDRAHSIEVTQDGGFIIGGMTNSYGAGNYDAWLIRTDANGDTLWTKTFGGPNYDNAYSVELTLDGGYVLTGSYGSNGVWLIKTDSLGNAPPLTGVSELLPLQNTLSVYPNPVQKSFTIKGNILLPATITLYDITGRKVMEQILTGINSQVNISHLSKGFYIYKIKAGKDGYFTGKLIKQ